MKASILTIGTELLIGQVLDTNAHWLSQELNKLGITIVERRTINDNHELIIDSIRELSLKSNFILTTGGLGPTKDDITKKAIADYLEVDLHYDEEIYKRIVYAFEIRNIPITSAHKEQCYFPDGVKLLENKLGTAPGMLLEKENISLISMPGVPYEMKYIFENGVKAFLATRNIEITSAHRTIRTVGVGETIIEQKIQDIEDRLLPNYSIAYLPSIAQVRVRISGKDDDANALNSQLEKYKTEISQQIEEYVYGFGDIQFQEAIQKIMIENGQTLSLAESCTGGYLSHIITEVPGCSAYYKGSIVAYSYEAKMKHLGVSEELLAKYGAVSEETVISMAEGCKVVMNSDFAISASGIAGPGGGMPNKPVGTVWIACTDGQTTKTRKLTLSKDRLINIKYTAIQALNLLRHLMKAQK